MLYSWGRFSGRKDLQVPRISLASPTWQERDCTDAYTHVPSTSSLVRCYLLGKGIISQPQGNVTTGLNPSLVKPPEHWCTIRDIVVSQCYLQCFFFSANIAVYTIILNWTERFLNAQYYSSISMPRACKEERVYKRGRKKITVFLCSAVPAYGD